MIRKYARSYRRKMSFLGNVIILILLFKAGADQGFSVGGTPTLQGKASKHKFSQKLLKIKNILVRRGSDTVRSL